MAKRGTVSKTPLEERTFERANPSTGLTEVVPALDTTWITEVNFLPYHSPSHLPPHCSDDPSISGEASEQDDPQWVETLTMLDEDLHWLLQLDHHKFWCQVMRDSSLQRSLDSYLCFAPRPRDKPASNSLETLKLLRSIHRRVFMVFLRMSTHKESGDSFFSVAAFSRIIYEHYLFDLPRILDLCSLYGVTNRPLLAKMVANVFEKQPKYLDDWGAMVGGTVMGVFSKMAGDQERNWEAVRLDRAASLSVSEFSKLVLYISDFAGSLRGFLEVYSPACFALMVAGFVGRVVSFYESTVTMLQENWHCFKDRLTDPQHTKEHLRFLKRDLAWLVHELLHKCFITPRPQDSSGIRSKNPLDGFISAVSDIASEKSFLKEYRKQFDMAGDVSLVQRAHPEIPETHFDYVLSALMEDTEFLAPTVPAPTASSTPAPSSGVAGVLQSLVSQVKDLLPHLGEGFIEICLREFNNNPETVINKILEDSLPPHLNGLNFGLPANDKTTPLAPPPVIEQEESLFLDQRESVFDNDDFDVLRRPEAVDLSRVHIGKKFDHTSVSVLLDDKSHLETTRGRYRAYEVETPLDYASEDSAWQLATDAGGMVGEGFDVMYDDEYDDTYDSHNVGAADDATDEQYTVKRLNQKGMYGRHWQQAGHESDGEGSSGGPQQGSASTNEKVQAREFIRNYMKTERGGHRKGGEAEEGRKLRQGGGEGGRREELREGKGRRGEAKQGNGGGRREEGWKPRESNGSRVEEGWKPREGNGSKGGRGEERWKPKQNEWRRGEEAWKPRESKASKGEEPRKNEEGRGEERWKPKQNEWRRGEEAWKPRESKASKGIRGEEPRKNEEGRGEEGWKPREGNGGGEEGWKPRETRGEEGWKPRESKGKEGWKPMDGREEKGWKPREIRGEDDRDESWRREDGKSLGKMGSEQSKGRTGGEQGVASSAAQHREHREKRDGDHGNRNSGGHSSWDDGDHGNWDHITDPAMSSTRERTEEAAIHSKARGMAATPNVKGDSKDGVKGQPGVKGDSKDGQTGVSGKPSEAKGKAPHSKGGSTQRSRQVKDRNKGGQANHNRKAMADKKMRGGMF